MQRDHLGVARIERQRSEEPLVTCQFAEIEDRLRDTYGSCGEIIPYKPGKPCPACGQSQIKAFTPRPPDNALVVDGNAAIIDAESGEVIAVQVVAATELASRLGSQLQHVNFSEKATPRTASRTGDRLSGIMVNNRTFGYTGPQPMRRRYGCSRSQFDREYPEVVKGLDEMCKLAERVFRTHAYDVYDKTTTKVKAAISDAWLMSGTPWTSGIINHTASLPYHRDSGNISGSWSAMLGARHNMEGGLLHLVDYDVWLAIPHGSISIFDGQSVLHGVSPMRVVGPNPYRFTVVTYAKTNLKKCCGDPALEPLRAAKEATLAEDRRRNAT